MVGDEGALRARSTRDPGRRTVLWTVWIACFLLVALQGWRSLGAPRRFADLPSSERLEWVERAWTDEGPADGAGTASRVLVAGLLGAGLIHLLQGVDHEVGVWMVEPGLLSPLRVGAGLLGIWVAAFALYRLLEGQWSGARLELARGFLAPALQEWRERALCLFQELLHRRDEVGPDAVPVVLTAGDPGPGALPYRRFRLTALAMGEEGLLVARSPVVDGEHQSQYLAIDLAHRPRLELEPEEVERLAYGEILEVEHRAPRDGGPGAEVVLTLASGAVRVLPGDPEGARLAARSLAARLRAGRSEIPRRRGGGVVLLETTAAPRLEARDPGEDERRECGMCAELIRVRARRCRFCGYEGATVFARAS